MCSILSSLILGTTILLPGVQPAPVQPALSERSAATRTLLTDGSTLVIGGLVDGRPSDRLMVEDGRGQSEIPLRVRLRHSRAWHSATVLPDGVILILGGIGPSGVPVHEAELFDPRSGLVRPIAIDIEPRAAHSATLLTDGRVLIVGGRGHDGALLTSATLWDPASNRVEPVSDSLVVARSGQQAELAPDGSVLLTGGTTLEGGDPPVEAYSPDAGQFFVVGAPYPPLEGAFLAGSIPEHGSVDVAPPDRIALRFSAPVLVTALTDQSFVLSSEQGTVPARFIVAEDGRLVFVHPLARLSAGAVYTLTVESALDQHGRPITGAITFATAGEPNQRGSNEVEQEAWIPGPDARGSWRTGRPPSPWAQLPPLKAPPGVTAVAGQVLALNGRPLADVTLSVGDARTSTDRTGRFLLQGVTAGRGVLLIDSSPMSRPGREFGIYHARLHVRAGETNVLPFTIWLPRIDTAHTVRVSVPTASETVVTTPFIPGLELHIPKGAIIRDYTGRVVREISITPIPLDRPPFPLPTSVEVPVYFTIQPGGGFIETPGSAWPLGAQVVYPNYRNHPPGTRMHFWNYDPDERGWYVYGGGAVNAAGTRVVPDEGVVIYRFTGTMTVTPGLTPPGWGPPPSWGPWADPVDPSTGLFVMTKTDLHLPDVLPLTLTRTYRQNDTDSRPFGIGATHPYAMFLWSAQQYQEADLILPDGGRVHYLRISSGTGFMDAVFEHTSSPGAFYKSRLAWNGNGWDLTLKDGSIYVFGNEAPLQSIRDRYGNIIQLTWSGTNGYGSGIGNIGKVTSPNGRWIAFTYDTSNRIIQVADNIGRTVGYQYDASGRLWKVTDPAAGVTEYTYDAAHRMLTIKDARGIVYLTNEYDGNGRVIRQTQADNSTYELAYTLDGSGRVVQAEITNPRGYVDRLTFNSSGYLTSHVEAHGIAQQRTTTFTRRSDNLLESVTDPLNRETEYTYDTNGNVTSVTRLAGTPDAVTTSFTYESAFSQLASVTDPLNHTSSFSYDTLGRLTTITDALNHQTTLTYNAAGQPLSLTTAENDTTQFGYDFGDLVSVTDPLGRSSTRFVDAAGRMIATTTAAGQTTLYTYNALNLRTKITDPLGGDTSFTYDGNGNLLTLMDARGKTTTWTYDNMDRVETRTDPLQRQESFDYDANANLTQTTDRKGQVTLHTYDPLDRLTFTGFGATGTPPTYDSTIGYTYDDGDRLTQVVDSGAGTITRTFDLLDRLTSETTPEGSIAYTYDAAGRRASMTVAGQPTVSYTYDDANRLTGITQSTSSVAFAYDDANLRTSLTLPNGIVMSYAYDAASQLTDITYTLGSNALGALTYAYDLAGRRTAIGGTWARTNLPTALNSASYDDANQIAQFGGTTFTYDANGNLTNDGTRSYTWNARNELTSLSGSVPGSFAYDAFGRRRSKTVSGTSTGFLYDGLNPVQELAGGLPAANLLTGMSIDEFLMRTDTVGARHFLSDVLVSTVALADSGGAVQTEYTYAPFGALTTTGAGTSNAFTFTARELDATGLYFYRARYYDWRSQRFITEDPLGFVDGANVHTMTGNDPVNHSDPLGLLTILIGGGVSAAFQFGVEGSAGAAINPGWGGCAGIGGFASGGAAAGVNIGADAFVGAMFGGYENVSGPTVNVNVTFWWVSITGFFQPGTGRWMGGTVGLGPGALPFQASGSYAETRASGGSSDCGDRDNGNNNNSNNGGGGNGGGGNGGSGGRGSGGMAGRKG